MSTQELVYAQLVRQDKGGRAWEANGFKGLINWCTAVGKSFYTVYKHPTDELYGFIQRYRKIHPDKDILIILHDKINLEQWYTHLLLNYPSEIDVKIKLFTMDGIMSQVEMVPIDLEGGLLIIDEIHKLTSNIKRELWNGRHIKFEHNLFLTGTEEMIDKYAASMYDISPIVDKIDLKEANELGFIHNSDYTVILQQLDAESMDAYKEYSSYIRSAINVNDGRLSGLYKYIPFLHGNWRNPDFDIDRQGDVTKMLMVMHILMPKGKSCRGGAICKTTANPNGEWIKHDQFILFLAKEMGYTEDLDERDPYDQLIISQYSPENLQTFVINLYNAWYDRPKLIKNHMAKVEATYTLLKLYDFTRSVIFSESTFFTDELHRIINERQGEVMAVKYHSKVKIPKMNADGTPKTMKRRKDLEKYARGMENPIFKQDKQGTYLEVPVHIGKDSIMPHNKEIMSKLPKNKGVYVFAQAGDTGFNDPLIRLCIITSYSSSSTKSRQREGRTLRVDANDMGTNKQILYLAFEDTYEIRKISQLAEKLASDNVHVTWTTLEGFMSQDKEVNLGDVRADDFVVSDDAFDLSTIGL